MDMKTAIMEQARIVGFDSVGVAPAQIGPREQARLAEFVAEGQQGDMAWMSDTLHRRRDPKTLWAEVKSVLVLGQNYGPEENPLSRLLEPGLANVSCYAWNRDYHDLIKKRLKRLARWMCQEFGGDVKVFVDTAPVMEKPLAALAGIGWQGKHTNLVSRSFGSWLFLGEIYTTLDLDANRPHEDRCGNCRACLDICPTHAFPTAYTLDARRCLSYWSIEYKGHIPIEFRKAMGNRIYGCDDCLAVCPWNKFATPSQEPWFQIRPVLDHAGLSDFLNYDDEGFRAAFSGSPVKRIGRDRFLRNVLIACGNSRDTALTTAILPLLEDCSDVVRAAAIWALAELAPDQAAREKSHRLPQEKDPSVQQEWKRLS